MTASRSVLVALAAGMLMISATGVLAQDNNSALAQLNSLVERRAERVDQWRADARIVLIMTIVVIFLGLATAGLQVFKEAAWFKPATIIGGLVISGLTAIQNTCYNADHRQLLRTAICAERLLDEVRLKLPEARFATDSEDWAALVEDVTTRLFQIDAMEEQLLSGEPLNYGSRLSTPPSFVFVPPAEAAQQPRAEPGWIARPPTGKDAVYFVGLGSDPSLATAREASRADALGQAVDYFAFLIERIGAATFDPETLSMRIVEMASIESTDSSFDVASLSWSYYTLVRLTRSTIESMVEFHGIEQRRSVPETLPRELALPGASDRRAARGRYSYRIHCQACHGASGKGDGPLAELLKVGPTDLTRLALKNGGEYPESRIFGVVDGRNEVRGHGFREMPVWGMGFQDLNRRSDQETEVREKILDLTAYIKKIQVER